MSLNNSTWRWTGAFAALFLFSQDLWFWDAAIHLGPGNFPLRIYYFVLLQFLLVVLLAVFVRRLLRGHEGEPD